MAPFNQKLSSRLVHSSTSPKSPFSPSSTPSHFSKVSSTTHGSVEKVKKSLKLNDRNWEENMKKSNIKCILDFENNKEITKVLKRKGSTEFATQKCISDDEGILEVDVVNSPDHDEKLKDGKQIFKQLKNKTKPASFSPSLSFNGTHSNKKLKKSLFVTTPHPIKSASKRLDYRSDKTISFKEYYNNPSLIKKPQTSWFSHHSKHHSEPFFASTPNSLNNPDILLKQHSFPFASFFPPSFMEYYLASMYDHLLKSQWSQSLPHPPFPPPTSDFKPFSNNSNSFLKTTEKDKNVFNEDKTNEKIAEKSEKRGYFFSPWSASLTHPSFNPYLQHPHNTFPLVCPFHTQPLNPFCSKPFSSPDQLIFHIKSHWFDIYNTNHNIKNNDYFNNKSNNENYNASHNSNTKQNNNGISHSQSESSTNKKNSTSTVKNSHTICHKSSGKTETSPQNNSPPIPLYPPQTHLQPLLSHPHLIPFFFQPLLDNKKTIPAFSPNTESLFRHNLPGVVP